jgi:hypothetical protein
MRARAAALLAQPILDANIDMNDHDKVVDFNNAVLYIGALQTILAVVVSSLVSILSCTLLPTAAVSAIRTLTLSSICGYAIVRKPFNLGRVHGQLLIFSALRPAVPLYIFTLVLEQLVHSCARDAAAPSWRRLVVHISIVICIISGFMRARKPLQQTDLPFLISAGSLFCVAMLPPPAVLLSGPLCAQITMAAGAERLARAFTFSLLYSIFVYSSAPPMHCPNEVAICTMRASAASVWTLGCHAALLPLAVLQICVVLYVRVQPSAPSQGYERVPLLESEDVEMGETASKEQRALEGNAEAAMDAIERFDKFTPTETSVNTTDAAPSPQSSSPIAPVAPVAPTTPVASGASGASGASVAPATPSIVNISANDGLIAPEFSAIGERSLIDISRTTVVPKPAASGIASAARMAEIAAQLSE